MILNKSKFIKLKIDSQLLANFFHLIIEKCICKK